MGIAHLAGRKAQAVPGGEARRAILGGHVGDDPGGLLTVATDGATIDALGLARMGVGAGAPAAARSLPWH